MQLNIKDVLYLDNVLLGVDGRIKLLPLALYKEINPIHLKGWANLRARYTLPTIELVNWLKNKIAGRKAIEIGSGNGDLGFYLDIPRTDNYSQNIPEVKFYFLMNGVTPTQPSIDVEHLDAVEAIDKYEPEVVVGSFITQKAYENDPNNGESGNYFGPEEEDILQRVECYIHVGNEGPHGKKRLLCYPHETHRPEWLVTRCVDPNKNVIYVWGE